MLYSDSYLLNSGASYVNNIFLLVIFFTSFIKVNQKKNFWGNLIFWSGQSRNFLKFINHCYDQGRISDFLEGGGANFQKKIRKFWRPFFFFFRSTKLIFRALPKQCFAPILAKFSAPQANFWKNSQKSRFGHFLKNFDKKIAFFLARAPPQS